MGILYVGTIIADLWHGSTSGIRPQGMGVIVIFHGKGVWIHDTTDTSIFLGGRKVCELVVRSRGWSSRLRQANADCGPNLLIFHSAIRIPQSGMQWLAADKMVVGDTHTGHVRHAGEVLGKLYGLEAVV
jgi:hypothetical protein